MDYQIRKAKQSDLASLAAVEACCFPASEAASGEAIEKRLKAFGDCFFVAETMQGEVIGFINGCVTDRMRCLQMYHIINRKEPISLCLDWMCFHSINEEESRQILWNI